MPVKKPEDAQNELHRLLLKAVPPNNRGNKTVLHLAKLLGVTRWSVNKWVTSERISPIRVKQICEIAKIGIKPGQPPRVQQSDFERFVYNV